jgi:hypothetical protein
MKEPQGEERQERVEKERMDEGIRQRLEGFVPEIIRRMFYAGLGAVFTTEEGMRRLATEFSLPKDVARFLIQQAQGTKNELFRIVATELRGFLENLNLTEELLRLLTSLTFEINTQIRLLPNEAKLIKPQIKNRVTVKQAAREEEKPAAKQSDKPVEKQSDKPVEKQSDKPVEKQPDKPVEKPEETQPENEGAAPSIKKDEPVTTG